MLRLFILLMFGLASIWAGNCQALPQADSSNKSKQEGSDENSKPAGFPTVGGSTATGSSNYVLRTWRDKTGKFEIRARLQSKTSEQVVIKKENGKSATVPIAKLSAVDIAYLETLKEDENPFSSLADTEDSSPAGTPGSSNLLKGISYRLPLTPVASFDDVRLGAESLAISPNNAQLVIGRSGAEVTLCSIRAQQVVMNSGRMEYMGDVTAAKYSPDGSFLIIGGEKGAVEVYSISEKNGKLQFISRFSPHTSAIVSIAFSGDGKHVLTGGNDREARYWEVATGKQIASITSFGDSVISTCIRPTDNMLLATDGKKLVVYNPRNYKTVRTVALKHSTLGRTATISPNGLILAISDINDIRLWNLIEFREMPIIKGTSAAASMVFGPDSRHLISGHSGTVSIWDAKFQTRIISNNTANFSSIDALGISNDGSLIAFNSGQSGVIVLQAGREQ